MQSIRSKNTKPEMLVRRYLFENGFRFRIHVKSLPGKPDIVLPKYRTVIQVHGCFWHGHVGCKFFNLPKTRTKWWKHKIETNRKNDEKNQTTLSLLGWRVISVFECELKTIVRESTLRRLVEIIKH